MGYDLDSDEFCCEAILEIDGKQMLHGPDDSKRRVRTGSNEQDRLFSVKETWGQKNVRAAGVGCSRLYGIGSRPASYESNRAEGKWNRPIIGPKIVQTRSLGISIKRV